ncbi:MAG: PIN domain-containing protein [Methanolinea sp.]|nr:PIN domain-containing protein [Methanolinea sp.]
MTGRVFIDTCIFFDAISDHAVGQVLQHLKNIEFSFCTSLPVLGEFVSETAALPDKEDKIRGFFNLVDTLDLVALVPDSRVSYACYLLCKYNEDERMRAEHTDLVHLGYAMAYQVPVFLTTDRHLSHFRIPAKLMEKGYQQPWMMDVAGVKREYLGKRR